MPRFVNAEWVTAHLSQPGFTIVDPRRPMKYLSGHLPGAINIPAYKSFGPDGRLLGPDALAEFLGGAGLGNGTTPILYDSPDGQNAAMIAWILEYLGHSDICVMEEFFEAWKAAGREVLYKPVEATPAHFAVTINRTVRASLDDVKNANGARLVDFRSREEFRGEKSMGPDHPGHIPGSVNLEWRDLADPPARIIRPQHEIKKLASDAGVGEKERIIAYCRSGIRASLGYMALREIGCDVRLFDGSFAEWSAAGLPAEK